MTLYRLYLRSRIRREPLARRSSFGAAQSLPSSPEHEERPSMIYGDHRYSYVISAREEYEAENDAAALAIAQSVFEAASDLCDAFELWDGTRQVDPSRMATLPTNTITAQRQDHLVQVEETLLNSGWAISRSRRLLARFNKLRDQGPVSPAPSQY